MSAGAPVYITGRLGTDFLRRIKVLSEAAITRAIYKAKAELESTVFKNPTIVPLAPGYPSPPYPPGRMPGTLQNSIVSFISPGQITFQWSAIDPWSGYNYAKIRDEEGGRIAPAGFSKRILEMAKSILMQYLRDELQAIQGAIP